MLAGKPGFRGFQEGSGPEKEKNFRNFHLLLRLAQLFHNWCMGSVPQSCLTLTTVWAVARQAPLSTGFSRQKSWSALPFPSPGDLPNPGIEPLSPVTPVVGRFFTTEPPGKAFF